MFPRATSLILFSQLSFIAPIWATEQLGEPTQFVFTEPGLKIKQQDVEFDLGATVMWDYEQFSNLYGDAGHGSEFRHTDITFKIEQQLWKAKLEIDLEQDEDDSDAWTAAISEAYLRYGEDEFNITGGRVKEQFGLERLTSSESLTLIERAMATSAFTPEEHLGVTVAGRPNRRLTWAVGLYQADEGEDSKDRYAVTGRLTYTPWQRENQVLHLGLSGSTRDLAGEKYKIKERAEVHTAENIVTGSKITTDRLNLLGLETAWVHGAFSAQAEYFRAQLTAKNQEDVTYSGYYLQFSYFLTQESRPYKNGSFDSIEPHGHWGAWEVVGRYSVLDAVAQGEGNQAANLTAGLNYYLNQQTRIMVNYLHTRLTEEDKNGSEHRSGNAFLVRMQYEF